MSKISLKRHFSRAWIRRTACSGRPIIASGWASRIGHQPRWIGRRSIQSDIWLHPTRIRPTPKAPPGTTPSGKAYGGTERNADNGLVLGDKRWETPPPGAQWADGFAAMGKQSSNPLLFFTSRSDGRHTCLSYVQEEICRRNARALKRRPPPPRSSDPTDDCTPLRRIRNASAGRSGLAHTGGAIAPPQTSRVIV